MGPPGNNKAPWKLVVPNAAYIVELRTRRRVVDAVDAYALQP